MFNHFIHTKNVERSISQLIMNVFMLFQEAQVSLDTYKHDRPISCHWP